MKKKVLWSMIAIAAVAAAIALALFARQGHKESGVWMSLLHRLKLSARFLAVHL